MLRPVCNRCKSTVVSQQQAALIRSAKALDPSVNVLGQTSKVLNAVMMEVDAAVLDELANLSAVASINPVKNYEMDLSETVPYIGAAAAQALGFDGSGIRVAILDSGIDYTHANLGGGGTIADYDAAYLDPASRDGLFPTAKVVEGYDFVGEIWPSGPLQPDEDPIDFQGHGTHVADIAGGLGGVAPGAELYAVKVCSAVSTSCSGVALIQGMEYAIDPNGDGDLSDHVDIVNMSLGSNYGQAFDDDLAQAVENATAVGVLTVASAGNGSDKPYVTGTPAAAPSALSVAQTNVPSAFQPLMQVISPASIAGDYAAVYQPWSGELTSVIEAPVVYGVDGNTLGCTPFAPGSVDGMIVLVDRGSCSFSVKIDNIGQGGGVVGIIGLVAPGDPFAGGFGGGNPVIPGYMISQADANTIKSGLAEGVVARFDPDYGIALVGHMVGSSSRGPSMNGNLIKPEIGAPGASVSAIVGTGDGTGPFGGTSGAAPMVTGSAAIVLGAFPDRMPHEVKAVLMNTAETNIMNTPAFFGGDLAPIARIGNGEVRVDQAIASPAAAWDSNSLSAALSFGFHDVPKKNVVQHRTVTVRNYSDTGILYNITPSFRFVDDELNGAVRVITPNAVYVPANGDASFQVTLQVRGDMLREWGMNSGSLGADPATITLFEYDGYITLTEVLKNKAEGSSIHLGWHILPRGAGDVLLREAGDIVKVFNRGVGTTTIESYSLVGVSDDLPEGGPGEQNPTPDLRYVGYATYPVPAGYCSANPSFVMAFAVNTWERQTHSVAPAYFQFDLDTDQDGFFDYSVFNLDLSYLGASFNLSDGRNATIVRNYSTNTSSVFFYTDHETNSGNTVLYICGEQIGMNASNFFDPMDVYVAAFDLYFGGDFDFLPGFTISPLGEQYLGVFENGGVGSTTLAYRESDVLEVLDFGPITNNTETGLLLLYRGGAPADNEAGIVLP